ncbi:MAG: hypothetical protein WCK90_02410 [archaeon]
MYSKKAIWALILTVIPIVGFYPFMFLGTMFPSLFSLGYLSLILEVVGLILAIVSIRDIRNSKGLKGKEYAITAIVLSIIYLLITLGIFYVRDIFA